MNDRTPAKGRSETSGRRPPERSDSRGRAAVHDLDAHLELRERLVAIIDSLDEGEPRDALLNLRWLLLDLDWLAA